MSRETVTHAHDRGQKEMADQFKAILAEYLESQEKERELYPRNTKFVDVKIDAMEELALLIEERLKYKEENNTNNAKK